MPSPWQGHIPPATPRDTERGRSGAPAATGRAARLPWLLEIAGPAGRHALLEELGRDLARARSDFVEGLADGDRDRLSGALHVLVSLAGTLGDGPLTARVQALQRRLRDGSPKLDPAADLEDFHAGLDALHAEIDAAAQVAIAGERRPDGPADASGDRPR